ncbi:MAG: Hydrolase TatD [Chitinophagaceae bacterium]|nr:Hydrolase TatD [Chitinophagaceae bacterium]
MQLIDTHCHIYSAAFDADRQPMIERAKNEGVAKMLMPAIDSAEHESMLLLEQQNPGKCIAMMGLHPCSVKENYEQELTLIRQYYEKRSFIAVGEIGLDFYWDISFKEQQYDAFNRQVEWALQYDIPIVIHSRDSTDECIQVVKEHQKGKLKGVFHCFSGSVEQANQITELGLYLGIGGVVTFKNGGLDVVMKQIDLKHIVLETDAPYLAPTPFRGKRNECSYIKYVAQKLADIKALDMEEVAALTTKNAQSLFRL